MSPVERFEPTCYPLAPCPECGETLSGHTEGGECIPERVAAYRQESFHACSGGCGATKAIPAPFDGWECEPCGERRRAEFPGLEESMRSEPELASSECFDGQACGYTCEKHRSRTYPEPAYGACPSRYRWRDGAVKACDKDAGHDGTHECDEGGPCYRWTDTQALTESSEQENTQPQMVACDDPQCHDCPCIEVDPLTESPLASKGDSRREHSLPPRTVRICGRHGMVKGDKCEPCEVEGPLALDGLWFVVSESLARPEGIRVV